MDDLDTATRMTKSIRSTGNSSPSQQRSQIKKEVCGNIFNQLADNGHEAVEKPGFAEELQAHFNRLPTRYALDVHTDRAEDVLTHKLLLEEAKIPENCPAFHVRAVQILPAQPLEELMNPLHLDDFGQSSKRSLMHRAEKKGLKEGLLSKLYTSAFRLAPPAFGSSPNLEALALDSNNKSNSLTEDIDNSHHSQSPTNPHLPMHEITFSTIDKPKLLSQMSALLADVGLNIREAHVFSTADGYSLDVFVVDGWPTEDTQDLRRALFSAISHMEKGIWEKSPPVSVSPPFSGPVLHPDSRRNPEPVPSGDDWEIDRSQLRFNQKIANGTFGELYRGTYCGQDVAIKILKSNERLNENLQREFQQEVFIMRKVRHKNVVQFIGACTKPPSLCIVTEYMSGGSVYDYLHKQKAVLKLPMLLRVAIDISKGMDYLHQNNIIHRDLKAANLLMDENEVVKVADFGVARVEAESGIMTAETGTYRWMAPEIIEHKPYSCKADVFSFGVVLWELLTGKVPYSDLTPLQAAVGVVQKGLRPTIPRNVNPRVSELLQKCWKTNPAERLEFSEITALLQDMLKEVNEEVDDESKRPKDRKVIALFSSFKRATQR